MYGIYVHVYVINNFIHSFFSAGASSSILEDKHKVLEKILDDLHRGNFHPVVRSEVMTPDTDIEALEFSNISFIGSPVSRRPMSEVMDEDFLTPTLKHVNIRTSSGETPSHCSSFLRTTYVLFLILRNYVNIFNCIKKVFIEFISNTSSCLRVK